MPWGLEIVTKQKEMLIISISTRTCQRYYLSDEYFVCMLVNHCFNGCLLDGPSRITFYADYVKWRRHHLFSL